MTSVIILGVFVAWAPFAGSSNYYSYVSTIATLCLIAVYIGVGGAEVAEAWREHRPALGGRVRARSAADVVGAI